MRVFAFLMLFTSAIPAQSPRGPVRESDAEHFGAPELEQSLAVVKSSEINDFVQKVSDRLTAASPQPLRFRIFVYDQREQPLSVTPYGTRTPRPYEAVALTGSYLVVPVELFDLADNEAQFAATLAHAYAHVILEHTWVQRHGTCVVRSIPPADPRLRPILPFVIPPYSRNMETAADKLSAWLLAKAGYDPQAMADVLARYTGASPRFAKAWEQRLTDLKAVLKMLPQSRLKPPVGGFEDVRKLLTGSDPVAI